ncbi:odorant receptor 13a-like [Andrena cerasifolii]|uniref:odorant receptor 13a-like n=1 Tax=Andrena cerasifolii TaxID=2819439 RepID=UPI0040376674
MCIINLHLASQFRILQYRLTNMHVVTNHEKQMESASKDPAKNAVTYYAMFKRCVKQHQMLIEFSYHLERVFTLIVLGQVLLFSILMCLDGYLVLMDDAPTTKRLIFVFHITGCMCQLLMFTYSCDCLVQESTAVASAVYSAPWSLLSMSKDGKELRKDMVLVIMRSRVPCCLTASGFFIVSLETYTRVLSTAVSYFTLLNSY